MAISKIQQSQISGSLSQDDSLAAGSGLAGKSTLKGDLDALRSQMKRIIGKDSWYSALEGSQDLADIYAAVRMTGANADFQGTLDVTGAATLDSSLSVVGVANLQGLVDVGGALYVDGAAGLSGSLAVAGAAALGSSLAVTGVADFSDSVYIDGSAGITGSLAVGGTLSAGATLLSSVTVSGATALNGGLTMDTNKFVVADGTGNVTTQGTLGVAGAANFSSTLSAGASTLSSLVVTTNGSIGGTLGVAGIAQFTNPTNFINGVFITGSSGLNVGDDLSVPQFQVERDGSMVVKAASSMQSLSITGSAGLAVSGPATIGSTLGVTGAATFSSTLQAGASTLASAGITGNATVGGTLGVTGAVTLSSTLQAGASSLASLGVAGSSALAGALSVAGASSLNSLAVTGSAGLAVASAADFNGGVTANSIKLDGDVAQRLYIVDSDGSIKDESKLVFDGSDLAIIGGLRVSGNAQVDGDLLVKGAFTYIETENMKVKDAFIYLATGSNGSVDSGLVLSKGAGASHDLILGQDGGAGEVIFAKVAHNSVGDSPADLNGADLVPAWMSSMKLGAVEGSLSGSLAASAAGLSLSSAAGKEIAISAASDLKLAANGNAAISFAAAEQVPNASFAASTVVGMLNELRIDLDNASAGGNVSKAAYSGSQVAAGVLSFAGQQTLASANHKLVDVFLNGVLMAPGYDLTAITTTSVTFHASISFIADDVIVVVARG